MTFMKLENDKVVMDVDEFEVVLKACIYKLNALKRMVDSCMGFQKKKVVEHDIAVLSSIVQSMKRWIVNSDSNSEFVIGTEKGNSDVKLRNKYTEVYNYGKFGNAEAVIYE